MSVASNPTARHGGNTDALTAAVANATDAIAMRYPIPSQWEALEGWARVVAEDDTETIMTAFQTGDEAADALATYGILTALSPSYLSVKMQVLTHVEQVTGDNAGSAKRLITGISWAIDHLLDPTTDQCDRAVKIKEDLITKP